MDLYQLGVVVSTVIVYYRKGRVADAWREKMAGPIKM